VILFFTLWEFMSGLTTDEVAQQLSVSKDWGWCCLPMLSHKISGLVVLTQRRPG
jgi:hypothetical protein